MLHPIVTTGARISTGSKPKLMACHKRQLTTGPDWPLNQSKTPLSSPRRSQTFSGSADFCTKPYRLPAPCNLRLSRIWLDHARQRFAAACLSSAARASADRTSWKSGKKGNSGWLVLQLAIRDKRRAHPQSCIQSCISDSRNGNSRPLSHHFQE